VRKDHLQQRQWRAAVLRTVGDGCGGTLNCPATCASPAVCGSPLAHLCGCAPGTTTSISGTVYDPAGNNPLYNVIVYVPSQGEVLDAIPVGVTCPTCDQLVSGKPIAAALTDATGHFVLNNVPFGTSFSLVMQLGRWRRQVTIPAVTNQCADNPIVETPPVSLLRLPRSVNSTTDQGQSTITSQYLSMPKFAIAAGHAQNTSNNPITDERLQCLLRRIGVDASEFTLPGGAGSVKLYNQLEGALTRAIRSQEAPRHSLMPRRISGTARII